MLKVEGNAGAAQVVKAVKAKTKASARIRKAASKSEGDAQEKATAAEAPSLSSGVPLTSAEPAKLPRAKKGTVAKAGKAMRLPDSNVKTGDVDATARATAKGDEKVPARRSKLGLFNKSAKPADPAATPADAPQASIPSVAAEAAAAIVTAKLSRPKRMARPRKSPGAAVEIKTKL